MSWRNDGDELERAPFDRHGTALGDGVIAASLAGHHDFKHALLAIGGGAGGELRLGDHGATGLRAGDVAADEFAFANRTLQQMADAAAVSYNCNASSGRFRRFRQILAAPSWANRLCRSAG